MFPGMEKAIEDLNPGGAKRRSFTKTERAEHVAAWKRGGMSAERYAAAHGLKAATLYAWSRERRSEAEGACGRQERSSFVPVRLSGGAGAARVVLRSAGVECVIEGLADVEALAGLAGALKRRLFNV